MLNSIKKYYLLVIVFVLFISYGQTLAMLPWQDDNALFFKLAHIEEPAGFLGSGIFGERAYKYTAFFYYPIYLMVGYKEFFYFLMGFVLYGVSTVAIYKVASKILDKNSGMLAGFLYACGYIGSDSHIRLFNSVITSLSVILVCGFIYYYWSFYKERTIRWYLLSLSIFFLAAEFARARTHYLVAIPILFELFFFVSKKLSIKPLIQSILRVAPFLVIFYRYVILEDFRSKEGASFVISLIQGSYYKTIGFLSSFSNLILPDWLTRIVAPNQSALLTNTYLSNSGFYFAAILITISLVCVYICIKFKKIRIYAIVFFVFTLIWKLISSKIFLNPALVVTPEKILIAYIGGEIVFLSLLGFFLVDKKHKPVYLLLLSGVFVSLLSYSAYSPMQVYEKINRYLSHSFIFLTIFLALIYFSAKGKARNIILVILVVWGLSNMSESFLYQRNILINRTTPVRVFYKDLYTYLPKINKGDVLYFDIADNAQGRFSDAFSVAQMPNTTAIAWRYGIDRYDFQMFENPEDLFSYLSNKDVKKESLHTFFYSKDGLFDTSEQFKSLLGEKKIKDLQVSEASSTLGSSETSEGTWINKSEIEINDNVKIPSFIPLKLLVNILAKPINANNLTFPIHYGPENFPTKFIADKSLVNLAFQYSNFKNQFRQSSVVVSSDWQGRVGKNLIDGDTNSSWEADRLLWLKGNEYAIIKMNNVFNYDRLAFINSYSDNTPLEFDILSSNDFTNWSLIKTYKSDKRLGNSELSVIGFPQTDIKYIKIQFKKTLNGDSPAISEIWLVPTMFSNLDIKETELFLTNPFGKVASIASFESLLRGSSYVGKVELSWANDKKFGWQKDNAAQADVIFDGQVHSYKIPIMAGGTNINRVKFMVNNFPGEITITGIKVIY